MIKLAFYSSFLVRSESIERFNNNIVTQIYVNDLSHGLNQITFKWMQCDLIPALETRMSAEQAIGKHHNWQWLRSVQKIWPLPMQYHITVSGPKRESALLRVWAGCVTRYMRILHYNAGEEVL